MHAGEQLGLDDGSLAGRVGLVRALVLVAVAVVIGGLLLLQGVGDGGDTVAASETGTTLSDEGSVTDSGPGGTIGSDDAEPLTNPSASGDATTSGDATASTLDGAATTGATTSEASVSTTTVPKPSTSAVATTAVAGASVDSPAGITVLVLNAASEKGVAGKGAEVLKGAGYKVMAPKNADALGKSKILYLEGSQAAAEAVATVFGADASIVAAFDPSAPPIATIGDADVIVVIGTDGRIKT